MRKHTGDPSFLEKFRWGKEIARYKLVIAKQQVIGSYDEDFEDNFDTMEGNVDGNADTDVGVDTERETQFYLNLNSEWNREGTPTDNKESSPKSERTRNDSNRRTGTHIGARIINMRTGGLWTR